MIIFSNVKLEERNVDFTLWETFNGDYVKIADVGSSYIERSMDVLEWHMERYPHSTNYSIWQRYMEVFEKELSEREYLEDIEDISDNSFYSKIEVTV